MSSSNKDLVPGTASTSSVSSGSSSSSSTNNVTSSLQLLQFLGQRLKQCHNTVSGWSLSNEGSALLVSTTTPSIVPPTLMLSSTSASTTPTIPSSPRARSTTTTTTSSSSSNNKSWFSSEKIESETTFSRSPKGSTAGANASASGSGVVSPKSNNYTFKSTNNNSGNKSPRGPISPKISQSPRSPKSSMEKKNNDNEMISKDNNNNSKNTTVVGNDNDKRQTTMLDWKKELNNLLNLVKQVTELIENINTIGNETNNTTVQISKQKPNSPSVSLNNEINADSQDILYELYNAYVAEYNIAPSANYLLRYGRQRGAPITYAQSKEFIQNISLLDRMQWNNQAQQEKELNVGSEVIEDNHDLTTHSKNDDKSSNNLSTVGTGVTTSSPPSPADKNLKTGNKAVKKVRFGEAHSDGEDKDHDINSKGNGSPTSKKRNPSKEKNLETDSLHSQESSDTWNFLAYAGTSDIEVLAMLRSKIEELFKQQGTWEELQTIWHHEYDWLMKSLSEKDQEDEKNLQEHATEMRKVPRGRSVSAFHQAASNSKHRNNRAGDHYANSGTRRRRYFHRRTTRRPLGFHNLKTITETRNASNVDQDLAAFLLENYFSDSDEEADPFEAQKVYDSVLKKRRSSKLSQTSFPTIIPGSISAQNSLADVHSGVSSIKPFSTRTPGDNNFARRTLYRVSFAGLDDGLKDRVSKRVFQRKSANDVHSNVPSNSVTKNEDEFDNDNDSDSDLISELSTSKGVTVMEATNTIGSHSGKSQQSRGNANGERTSAKDLISLATINKWDTTDTPVLLRGGSLATNYSTLTSTQATSSGGALVSVIMQPLDSKTDENEHRARSLTRYNEMGDVMVKYQEKMNQWEFDAFEFMDDPSTHGLGLSLMAFHICKYTGVLELCEIEPDKFWNFSEQVQKGYLNNPYHNQYHACDVLVSTYYYLRTRFMKSHMTVWDEFGGYVAAMVHDIGHDGYNNAFHSSTASNLALLYGDASLLENYHVSETFRILSQSNCNWMHSHPLSVRRYLGILIRQIVLGTDMKHHGTHMANLNEMVKMLRSAVAPKEGDDNDADLYDQLCLLPLFRLPDCPPLADLSRIESDGFVLLHPNQAIVEDVICEEASLRVDSITNERFFLMEIIVHLADVSNPAKPLNIAKTWAYRVMEEFFCQGDEERKLGIPVTPMMDRHSAHIAKVQAGFLQFVLLPFFEAFTNLCIDAKECLNTLLSNLEHWKKMSVEESQTHHTSNQTPSSSSSSASSNKESENLHNRDNHNSTDHTPAGKTIFEKGKGIPILASKEPQLKLIEEDEDITNTTDIDDQNVEED